MTPSIHKQKRNIGQDGICWYILEFRKDLTS